jgi:hypothetical protein
MGREDIWDGFVDLDIQRQPGRNLPLYKPPFSFETASTPNAPQHRRTEKGVIDFSIPSWPNTLPERPCISFFITQTNPERGVRRVEAAERDSAKGTAYTKSLRRSVGTNAYGKRNLTCPFFPFLLTALWVVSSREGLLEAHSEPIPLPSFMFQSWNASILLEV